MEDKERTEKLRFCRLCDIFKDIPLDIDKDAERLYNLLDDKEKAGDELINERLKICSACDRNSQGTCLACGCYCIIRSLKRSARCPKKKWQ
jgi:hypothetical protein